MIPHILTAMYDHDAFMALYVSLTCNYRQNISADDQVSEHRRSRCKVLCRSPRVVSTIIPLRSDTDDVGTIGVR